MPPRALDSSRAAFASLNVRGGGFGVSVFSEGEVDVDAVPEVERPVDGEDVSAV